MKSAFLSVRGKFCSRRLPEGYLYLIHYKSAFAFSSILYPPRVSVIVTFDLLGIFRPFPRPCGVYPVVSSSFLFFVRCCLYCDEVLLFTRLKNQQVFNPLIGAFQPYLVPQGMSQLVIVHLRSPFKEIPLAPNYLRLIASATCVVCIPVVSLPT